MWAADLGLEEIVILTLDNKEASTQQDNDGYNIGMWAARSGLKNATQKAFLYPVGRYHKNKYGDSIESLALQNNIRVSQDGLEWEAFANDVVDSL